MVVVKNYLMHFSLVHQFVEKARKRRHALSKAFEMVKKGYALRKRKTRILIEYWDQVNKRFLKLKDKDPATYQGYQAHLLASISQ